MWKPQPTWCRLYLKDFDFYFLFTDAYTTIPAPPSFALPNYTSINVENYCKHTLLSRLLINPPCFGKKGLQVIQLNNKKELHNLEKFLC